jgi:hypothetical protein
MLVWEREVASLLNLKMKIEVLLKVYWSARVKR